MEALPRISCVSYHPNSGYVYAAGTGVFGLSHSAVRAVLAGMMMSHQIMKMIGVMVVVEEEEEELEVVHSIIHRMLQLCHLHLIIDVVDTLLGSM